MGFGPHGMRKCAVQSFYALGHFSLLENGAEQRGGIVVISRRSREYPLKVLFCRGGWKERAGRAGNGFPPGGAAGGSGEGPPRPTEENPSAPARPKQYENTPVTKTCPSEMVSLWAENDKYASVHHNTPLGGHTGEKTTLVHRRPGLDGQTGEKLAAAHRKQGLFDLLAHFLRI